MKPEAKLKRVLGEGRFLVLRELEYDNGSGPRLWEACDRNGTGSAAFILARIVPDDEILLVRQFRPPAGRLMLEFPAGLIDPGETAEQTAVRELYEETGYCGRVLGCSRPGWSSPGLTGETICMVRMEIDGDACRGRRTNASKSSGSNGPDWRNLSPRRRLRASASTRKSTLISPAWRKTLAFRVERGYSWNSSTKMIQEVDENDGSTASRCGRAESGVVP